MRLELEDCLSAIRIDVQMIEDGGPGIGFYRAQLHHDTERLKELLGVETSDD